MTDEGSADGWEFAGWWTVWSNKEDDGFMVLNMSRLRVDIG